MTDLRLVVPQLLERLVVRSGAGMSHAWEGRCKRSDPLLFGVFELRALDCLKVLGSLSPFRAPVMFLETSFT